MNAGDYLQRLQNGLGGFTPQERDEILEEIASHIESGQRDPGLGETEAARQQKLLAELGTPEQLGKGMNHVHHPRRWQELLLVLVPAYLLLWLVMRLLAPVYPLVAPGETAAWWGIRVVLAFNTILLLVSWRLRAELLQLYWVPTTLASLLSLVVREQLVPLAQGVTGGVAYGAGLESLFWLAALVGLGVWLARLVERSRGDLSLVMFGLWPLALTACNMAEALFLKSAGWDLDRRLWVYWIDWGWQVVSIGWLVLFFLSPRREGRWAALAVVAGCTFLIRGIWPHPVLVTIWASLPILMALAWAVDRRQRDRLRLRPGG